MNRVLRNFILFISLYLVYKYAFATSFQSQSQSQSPSSIMSNSNKNKDSSTTFEGRSQDEILVNIGGKQVPLSRISKPHAVVHPQPNQFPDVEKEAKQKEDSKAFDQAVLDPGKQKQQFDAASFPDVEPEAKKREAELEEARAKKNN